MAPYRQQWQRLSTSFRVLLFAFGAILIAVSISWAASKFNSHGGARSDGVGEASQVTSNMSAGRGEGTAALTDPQGQLPDTKEVESVSFYSSSDSDIVVQSTGIYPRGGDDKASIFHHTPVFPTVKTERVQSNPEEAWVIVTYASSSKAMRSMIARHLTAKLGLKTEPKVRSWPVTGELIAVVKSRLGEEVARARTLKRSEEQFEFAFYMTPSEADTLLSRPEEFTTTIYFASNTQGYSTGGVRISGSKNVGVAVRMVIASRDPSLGKKKDLKEHYLVGDETARLSRQVAALIEKSVYGDTSEVFYLAEKQAALLAERMLVAESIRELDWATVENHPDRAQIEAALLPYLQQRVKVLNDTRSGQDVEWNVVEKASGSAGGAGIAVLAVPVAGFASGEVTQRDLDRLIKGTSTGFVKSSTAGAYTPHDIRIAKIRQGYEQVEFNEHTILHIPLGHNGAMLVAAGVPLNFTLKAAEKSLYEQGMILPAMQMVGTFYSTLSATHPGPGWVNATDGKTYYFPNEPWVPDNLRGQNVPDLRRAAIVGVPGADGRIDQTVIGQRTEGTDETQDIPGGKFRLGTPDKIDLAGRVAQVSLHGNYDGRHGYFVGLWGDGARADFATVQYDAHKAGSVLQGTAEVRPLTNVKAVVWVYGAVEKPAEEPDVE